MTPVWYPEPDADEAVAGVVAAFRAAYGRDPDGVWAAPGRVNLIGEHVDYQAGLCLPFALSRRTLAAVALRDDDRLRLRSAQQPDGGSWEGGPGDVRPGAVEGWAAYAAGVPWALRADGFAVPGCDVLVDGTVPLGAGLSSSAALECALALALDDLAGLGLAADDAGRARLAAACVRAENEIAGAPTGGMDQAAALRSRDGHALLLDCRDFSARHVPFDPAAAGLAVLVVDTRAHHALVDGRYGSRREACERACTLLGVRTLRDVAPESLDDVLAGGALAGDGADGELARCVRHVVGEIDRVRRLAALLEAGRLADGAAGQLLDASHTSLRDDYRVSCPELDLACEAARDAGARGARMTGGGFGGSAIALVEAGAVQEVARAVATAFARRGAAAPAFLTAAPSGAGGRVR